MTRDELLKRWLSDVERLLHFRRERGLEEWPRLARDVVPPEVAPAIDVVTLLWMPWEDVQLVKRRQILSREFTVALDQYLMMELEETIHTWDVATTGTEPVDVVEAVRAFCEAIDTAIYWSRGIRYLDEHLRS
jgi:hypothetical protein